jgi:hypothetical protein
MGSGASGFGRRNPSYGNVQARIVDSPRCNLSWYNPLGRARAWHVGCFGLLPPHPEPPPAQ